MLHDAEHEAPPPKEFSFYPDYNDEDSDLILLSNDGQGFRVHSLIMKLASDVFKTMIDVAQGQHSASQKEPLHLQEDGEVIKSLLDFVYPGKAYFGESTPSIIHLRDVCFAAEKYEMHSVLHASRIFLGSTIGSFPPLPAFALASRYEWEAELRLISTATLSINLYSAESTKHLQLVPSNGVIRLIELHRTRRDALVASLNLTKTSQHPPNPLTIQWCSVRAENASGFVPCVYPWAHFETPRWSVLQYRLLEEMERMSDGSSIRKQEFWDRSEFNRIWTTTCSSCGGGGTAIVNKHKLKDQVIRVLDNLPKTI